MNTQKTEIRNQIHAALTAMKQDNLAAVGALQDTVSLSAYAHLTKSTDSGRVWTKALQTALDEHEVVEEIYKELKIEA